MSAPRGWDEFELIARLLRPLAKDAPEALGLADDAALIPGKPGFDLVVTTDTLVEGVHFLPGDPPDLVARKLLRVNLSDLAAKTAQPYGYFLNTSWPASIDRAYVEAFTSGLALDQRAFGLKLFGGDTTATPGPLTLSATLLGWVSSGTMLMRSGARAGDLLMVSGTIGDGYLGLQSALGREPDLAPLIDRYRLPNPRLDLREALAGANACADVSDGLIADAGHLAEASGLALSIDLDRAPLSLLAAQWAGDRTEALLTLATGGDDYELVCAASVGLPGFTTVGRFTEGEGVTVSHRGRPLDVGRRGYSHGKDG